MASTAIQIYAPRKLVAAAKWIGGNVAYGLIKHWGRDNVRRGSGGELYLQTEEGVELVPVGNYVALIGDYFENLTPEEFDADYVQIRQEG